PIVSYLRPPKVPEANVQSVKAGLASEFPQNTAQIVKFGRKPVILIRTEAGDFRALSATCTHLDCIVQYREDLKQIWCACHNGLYDLKGRNISGPPPKPLDEYAVKVIEDEIHIAEMS
ncbi:MAG: Rieske (2Fe-2S) protein, partial [Candidatus Latescibacterota bacterium]